MCLIANKVGTSGDNNLHRRASMLNYNGIAVLRHVWLESSTDTQSMLGNRLDSSSLNIKRHTLSSGFLHLESVSREHESALTISIYHTVTSQTKNVLTQTLVLQTMPRPKMTKSRSETKSRKYGTETYVESQSNWWHTVMDKQVATTH